MEKEKAINSPSVRKIEEQLSSISTDESIEVNLKDLLFIYMSIEEFRKYLHNEDHYPSLDTIKAYIGNRTTGMYSVLDHIYINIFGVMLPKEIEKRLDDL